MKIFLFLLPFFVSCSGNPKSSLGKQPEIFKKDSACVDYFESKISFKTSQRVLLKNYAIIKKDGLEIIEGNCVDAIRIYKVNQNGNEIEEEKMTCISKKIIQIKLADSSQFHFMVSGTESFIGEAAKKHLSDDLITNTYAILKIDILPKDKTAIMVSRAYSLEEND